jgi:hypothetical protein
MYSISDRKYALQNMVKGLFQLNLTDVLVTWIDRSTIKGTVSRDFLTLVLFIKQLLLVPLDMPRNDYEYFHHSKNYSRL